MAENLIQKIGAKVDPKVGEYLEFLSSRKDYETNIMKAFTDYLLISEKDKKGLEKKKNEFSDFLSEKELEKKNANLKRLKMVKSEINTGIESINRACHNRGAYDNASEYLERLLQNSEDLPGTLRKYTAFVDAMLNVSNITNPTYEIIKKSAYKYFLEIMGEEAKDPTKHIYRSSNKKNSVKTV